MSSAVHAQNSEGPARAQNASDLGESALCVEVMERVPHYDGVGHAGLQWDRFRRSVESVHVQKAILDYQSHVPRRFNCDDLYAEEREPSGQLPRASREIEDERALAQPARSATQATASGA